MVFFTCNNCGESVKKNSVEKHYDTRCRNNPINVSCMDCLKDFRGEEYAVHTKCISEVEKYSGKNYVPKENKNKGQKKQETWMDIVRSILESTNYQLSSEIRSIFQRLQTYDNVPRKKAKFQNFVENCLRIHQKQALPVWEVLEKELENMKKAKQKDIEAMKTGTEECKKVLKSEVEQHNGLKRKNEVEEEKIKNKRKKNNAELIAVEENVKVEVIDETDTFHWSSLLEKVVAKHPEGLSLDKLKKKLLKKYKNKLNLQELSEKQQKKFEKKFSKTLKKCPAVEVDGELAKLC